MSDADPRLPRIDQDTARALASEAGIPDGFADLAIFQVLLAQPRLAGHYADLLTTLLFRSSFDAKLRELVIMRLGWATGAVYEWTQHWPIALRAGLSEAEVLGVRDWESHAGFGPAERAVLAATDDVLRDGAVSAATWDLCVAHVSAEPRDLLELVSSIAWWRMISTVLRSLRIPLEDGVEPWPPDGLAPPSA